MDTAIPTLVSRSMSRLLGNFKFEGLNTSNALFLVNKVTSMNGKCNTKSTETKIISFPNKIKEGNPVAVAILQIMYF